MDIIPKPIDIHLLGPRYMLWREAVDDAIGGTAEHLRNIVLMIAVPLLIVRGRNGLFIFPCLCAVWLFCLNPLLARVWMENILPPTYFRLVFLLQFPPLCALLGAAGPRRSQRDDGSLTNRTLTVVALLAIIVSFVHSYRGVSILPRDAKLGIGWKSPKNASYFLRTLILLKLQADTSRIPSYSLQAASPAVSYRFSFPK